MASQQSVFAQLTSCRNFGRARVSILRELRCVQASLCVMNSFDHSLAVGYLIVLLCVFLVPSLSAVPMVSTSPLLALSLCVGSGSGPSLCCVVGFLLRCEKAPLLPCHSYSPGPFMLWDAIVVSPLQGTRISVPCAGACSGWWL